jgi:hypothetical protein
MRRDAEQLSEISFGLFRPDQERLPQIDTGIGQVSAFADVMFGLDQFDGLASYVESDVVELLNGDHEPRRTHGRTKGGLQCITALEQVARRGRARFVRCVHGAGASASGSGSGQTQHWDIKVFGYKDFRGSERSVPLWIVKDERLPCKSWFDDGWSPCG